MRGTLSLSLSLSLSDLFVYLRAFYVRGILFRMKRVTRFCLAAFASGGFFSLSSSLLRALFASFSLERNGRREKKVTRYLSHLFGTENAKMCDERETRIAK